MPIRSCSDGDKPGYKWGDSGKCYLYTAGDEKSMDAAKIKAQMQGVAAQANGYEEKANEVTTSSMGSGIKNPQRGYGSKKKKKKFISDEFISKIAEDLAEEEAMLAEALVVIARMHGKFNEDETGIWAGYDSPEENDVKDIGVKCSNCVLYEGNGICKIIAQKVEDEGKCRFAIIPDGVVQVESADLNNGDNMDDGEEMINGYPAATQDITINIKNRQYCIDVANYGPMNPAISNPEFWQQKADIFKTSPEEAKTALCGNCAAFIQTTDMRTAIAAGLGGEDEAYAVINLANLGYCEIFDFKCAATRTCDAWVVGGPVNDSNANMSKTYVNVRKIQYRDPLN
ncbi:hypothetical protein UFOVP573_142 [uncultured Caudovirales phage]|uniref:Uncharacterized protein n=1 Tax=uncultured Caudovirales phage TaxID=2100421 RepID=A0A6J5SY65_9CAUD|nr:hypothetical protein UFOVP288_130 [uncultured Caudovirales phage]CAB4146104.1 hypothetical protein UFOVP483_66 [uncultured Caudovirales phage]CAB4151081.1 hypothetical protein UFOVP573_142 [uncultured Caudovirales phage]CAB4161616.1 hypothetical protein UFOVP769_130 [uncultured Caudovirales phage]CAB4174926.1 hypothetical protein UFOVP962_98 [uncultured Caudovirales phage]